MSDRNTSSGHLKNRMEQRMMMIPEIQNTDDKWFHMIYCQMRRGGGETTAGIAHYITSAAGQIITQMLAIFKCCESK